ncbi:MAG: hypothetical protein V7750_05825 [Sneathiella sp.]
MKISQILLLGILVFFTASCEEDPNSPYLEFTGGGFIFNYRIGEAFYGCILTPLRTIPVGTKITAEFEDPAGGPPLIVSQLSQKGQIQYSFRTPGIKQIKKGRPYLVTVSLLDVKKDTVFAEYTHHFASSIDQSTLPGKALTIGPGYHPNPD